MIRGTENRERRRHALSVGAGLARQVVELDGRRVSYLTAGPQAARQTILLIHGSGVSAGYWVDQLRGLGRDLRVVAIDLPGHGASDPIGEVSVEAYAEAASRLLEELAVGPVIVGGHSLGGAVAMTLAARHPERVAGLVLLSTCAKLPPADTSWERLLACLPGPLRKILFFSMAKKILFAAGAPGGAVSLGMQELRSCRPETILKDVQAARTMDLTDLAPRLQVPTLVLCGGRDRLTPPVLAEQLSALIPRAQLRILEGTGHMVLLEVPERVNREILAFARALLTPAETPASAVEEDRRGHSLARRFLDWARGIGSGRAVRGPGSRHDR